MDTTHSGLRENEVVVESEYLVMLKRKVSDLQHENEELQTEVNRLNTILATYPEYRGITLNDGKD